MNCRGEPKRRKKSIEPSCESSIVPVEVGPKTMQFPSRYASVHLEISHDCNRFAVTAIDFDTLGSGNSL